MRILFVKTSSLGDVVHNCPAVSDVARAFPQATIDWVVEEPFAPIAAMHGAVDRVIPVAMRRWRRGLWDAAAWSEFAAFRRALDAQHYDLVLDTQGLVKSALLARLAHGKRHGYDRASAREPLAALFYQHRYRVPRELHAVERNRRLAAAALGREVPSRCNYGLRSAGSNAGLALRTPYCVLLTMTSRADKLWPERSWAELCGDLARSGLQCVLPWGSDEEAARAQRLALDAPGSLVPPRLSLDALAALMQGAHAVIGLDTGLAHLAAALDVPVVGIYCGSDPALTGLYGNGHARNLGAPRVAPRPDEVIAALESLRP